MKIRIEYLIQCMSIIMLMMSSCTRTIEIERGNIQSYFSSFPANAQDIIAQGTFVIKTVGGMPSEAVLIGVSTYRGEVKKHLETFPAPITVEYLTSESRSSLDVVEGAMRGKMYSLDEFRSQFGQEVDDWSGFEIWYANFPASSGTRLNGIILSSSEEDMAIYMLFVE